MPITNAGGPESDPPAFLVLARPAGRPRITNGPLLRCAYCTFLNTHETTVRSFPPIEIMRP